MNFHPRLQHLVSTGKMGKLVASYDWSKSPLGDPEHWPSSLVNSIGIILGSKIAMYIVWGPEYIQIYNDAYIRILGRKHPSSLGIAAQNTWPEVWPTIHPLFKKVFNGESVYFENMPLKIELNHQLVEKFFTFSYSPIFLEDGSIGGIIDTVIETTSEVDLAEKFLNFQEESPNAFFSLSSSWVIDYMNQAGFEVLGIDASQIIGRVIWDVFPGLEHSVFGESYKKSMRGERQSFEGFYPHFNRWYKVISYQISKGVAVSFLDITDSKTSELKLQQERENFRNLFKQTPEMICILKGPEHVFDFVNEAHIKALGFNAKGMAVRVAQPESVEVHGILDDVYRTGVTAELLEIPVTLGTKVRYFNLTYAASRDSAGAPNGVMILGSEITEQVEAREGIVKALHTRDEFISIASHELKTPLTSLKMQLQLADRGLRSNRDTFLPKIDSTVNKSLKQVDRLSILVDDIMDVSRIQSGKLTNRFEDTDPCELLRDIVARFSDEYEQEIILHDKACGMIYGDPFRLDQVFSNLITNAIKYARTQIVITVTEDSDVVKIAVRDFGRGIAPEKLPLIFDRFERANEERNITGLGLGLYISKSIVEAHHGKLEVESSSEGATFIVILPKKIT